MAKLTEDQIKWILDIDAKGVHKEIAVTSSEINKLARDNRRMNKEMKEAERLMKQQEKEMQRLAKAGRENSDAYIEAKASMESARGEMESYIRKIGENDRAMTENKRKLEEMEKGMSLNEMSMRQLRQRAAELGQSLRATSYAANPEQYKSLQKELAAVQGRMGEVNNKGKGLLSQFAAMNHPVGTAAKAVQGFGQALKALIANPVGVVVMAIAAAFMAFKAAINSSEESAVKFQQVMAPFRVLMDLVLNIVQKLVKGFLDLTLGVMDWATKAAEKIPFIGNKMKELNEKAKEGVQIEDDKLALRERERKALVENSEKEMKIAELRNKASQRDIYSNKEIIAFLDEAMELEESITKEEIEQAKIKLELIKLENRHADNVAETNDQIAQQTALVNQLQTEHDNSTRRLVRERSSRIREMQQEDQAAARAALDKQIADIDFALKQETNLLRQQLLDRQISREQFDALSEQASLASLGRKLEIAGLDRDKRIEIEQQVLDFKLKALQQEEQFQKDREAIIAEWLDRSLDIHEKELAAIDLKHDQELEKLTEALNRSLITELEFMELRDKAIEEKERELAEKRKQQAETDAQKELQELLLRKQLEQMALQQAYNSGLISKQEYDDALLELDKKYNALALNLDNLSAEARRELQQQSLDFATQMMEKETEKQKKEQEKRAQLYSKFSEQIGTMLGGVIAGNEDLVKSSLKTILNMALDALEAQITMSIASATAQSFAQTDSVATFGASGAARAAVLTALIKGAFAGVKAIVNSALSGGKKSGASQAQASGPVSGARTVTGRQDGGFVDTTRSQDGKYFRALLNPRKRGFVDRPTVIVGDGPAGKSREWVASNDALMNPTVAPIIELLNRAQTAGNIRTIDLNQLMRARMAGFQSGGFISPSAPAASSAAAPAQDTAPDPIYNDIRELLRHLKDNGVKAPVVLSDLQRKQELLQTSQKIGSK